MKLLTEKLPPDDVKRVKKLYKWMKKQGLTISEATHLLEVTKSAIYDSRREKMNKIKL